MLDLTGVRARRPHMIAEAAAARRRAESPERLMVIAADHPGRGMLLGDRTELLDRLVVALARPGVNGVLGPPDILEDLLLLGALDEKIVFGSMNRGGLHGATWSLDDRFTAYDAAAFEASRFEGGKMLLRLDLDDPLTAPTLASCAHAVSGLAQRRLLALIEPFWSDTSAEGAMKAISVASALGNTSAYTWLKVPIVDDLERVLAASTLPALILGGGGPADYEAWNRALALPSVRGLVIGRSLLYPADGDVAAAVDLATGLVAA
jgi:hypothetical protein